VRTEVLTYLKNNQNEPLYRALIFDETNPISKEETTQCKEIIQQTLYNNHILNDYIQKNIYNTIDKIITQNKDIHLYNQIENIIVNNNITIIKDREIQTEHDVIDLIARYNETIQITLQATQQQQNGISIQSQLIEKIKQETNTEKIDENEKDNNKLYNIIINELNKEIEYYFAHNFA
jgi:hypothetical protein